MAGPAQTGSCSEAVALRVALAAHMAQREGAGGRGRPWGSRSSWEAEGAERSWAPGRSLGAGRYSWQQCT